MYHGAYAALANAQPLSEVRFVRDYLQLVFEPYTLTIYARLSVEIERRVLDRSALGFCDCVCRLIGERVVRVERDDGVRLSIVFSDGTRLMVSLRDDDAVAPEVAMLTDDRGFMMVDRGESSSGE